MQHILKRTAFIAAATLIPLANARAQFLSGTDISGCGGNSFNSCGTWSATATGNTLTFTITNDGGGNANSAWTEIGIGNIGDVYTLATGGFSYAPSDGSSGTWSYDPNVQGFNGFNLQQETQGANSDPGNPAVMGLTSGETITFTFTFNETINPDDFLNAQVAIHDQGTPEGCESNKVVFNGTTGEPSGTPTGDCGGSTVPEPSSMALLGTGLVGLVPLLRRRK